MIFQYDSDALTSLNVGRDLYNINQNPPSLIAWVTQVK